MYTITKDLVLSSTFTGSWPRREKLQDAMSGDGAVRAQGDEEVLAAYREARQTVSQP